MPPPTTAKSQVSAMFAPPVSCPSPLPRGVPGAMVAALLDPAQHPLSSIYDSRYRARLRILRMGMPTGIGATTGAAGLQPSSATPHIYQVSQRAASGSTVRGNRSRSRESAASPRRQARADAGVATVCAAGKAPNRTKNRLTLVGAGRNNQPPKRWSGWPPPVVAVRVFLLRWQFRSVIGSLTL